MQKIMFDDKYGLTKAVLEGRKTMTRRFAEKVLVEDENGFLCWNGEFKNPRYKPGEVVAVAQPYKDVIYTGGLPHPLVGKPGWTNKMFVRADLMPHQIRITDIHVERLQDISCMDCVSEGVIKNGPWRPFNYAVPGFSEWFETPQKAFAALIDKVSGKGTWDSNPYVYVYEFDLLK